MDRTDWLGPELFHLLLANRGSTDDLRLLLISCGVVWQSIDTQLPCSMLHLLGPRLCFFIVTVVDHDLFDNHDDSLTN